MFHQPPSPTGNHGLRKALWLAGQVPDWPADELPQALHGFHEDWRGESGYGEFRRVEGFSMYVDRNDIEMPLYKLVLADPKGNDFVDLVIRWNFKAGCEALVVVARQGQVHCKEEDWPLAEFNAEVREVLNLRRYSGLFLRHGTSCLVLACCVLYVARMSVLLQDQRLWWYEAVLVAIALLPSIVAIGIMPLDVWEKETLFSERSQRGPQNLDEVNVVTPKSVKNKPRGLATPSSNGVSGVSLQTSKATALQGPARMLLEESSAGGSPCLQLPGVEQRQNDGNRPSRARSAPPQVREKSFIRSLQNCCTDIQVGAEKCEVVAHERPQVTIRNLRQQAPPPPVAPPPHTSHEAALWSGSPVAVQSTELHSSDGSPGIPLSSASDTGHVSFWNDEKAVAILQMARASSTDSEKPSWRRKFLCPKLNYGSGLILGARFLELLVAFSCIAVLATSPALLGFPDLDSDTGAAAPLVWKAEGSGGLPFFRPTAAVLLASQELILAAGPVLRRFQVIQSQWTVLGEPLLLPQTILGLAEWNGHLVTLSSDGFRLLSLESFTGTTMTAQSWRNPLELIEVSVEATLHVQLPSHVDTPTLGTAAVMPSTAGNAMAVVLYGSGGLQLCRASNGTVLTLDFISSLKPAGFLPSSHSLHFSPDRPNEPMVLWSMGSTQQLSAVNFESGKILTTFQAAGDVASEASDASSTSLVTGNSSHLVLVRFEASTASLSIFSTPYPTLDFGWTATFGWFRCWASPKDKAAKRDIVNLFVI